MANMQLPSKVNFCLLLAVVNLLKHVVLSQTTEPIIYEIYDDLQPTSLIGNVVDRSNLREQYTDEVLRELHYVFLSEGIHQDYFTLDELSGDIHAILSVDRDEICPQEEQCSLRMDVAVKPTLYYEQLKVVINIADLNDNPPEFEPDSQTFDISEAASPGIVGPLRLAKDMDSPKNGIVKYKLRTDDDTFGVDVKNSSGEFEVHLVLNKSLDRETVDHYKLLLIAKDGGNPSNTGTLTVSINVLDVNDNNPKFERTTYDVNIPENLPPGTSLVTVQATDEDTGENGEILYSFSQQTVHDMDGIFSIERTTGMIYLQKELDYEQRSSYSLIVVAQDQGDNSLPANTRVVVNVVDVNDHTPRISMNALKEDRVVRLEEDIPEESFIAHISVYDEDDGINGHVECFLTGDEGKFQIIELFEKEFKIISTSLLDREDQSLYNLHIRCEDYGTPQLNTHDTLTVELLDKNDNAPEFSQDNYHAALAEHSAVGRSLLKVHAIDLDAGDNGKVIYSLDESSDNMFSINSQTGGIKVVAEFDREVLSQKIFHVLARDKGEISLTSTGTVIVEIVDIDDQVPLFTKKRFYMNVTENSSRDQFIGRVTAEDADSPQHGSFSYYLDGTTGSADSFFRINPDNGKLYTKRVLDREVQDLYVVPVIVQSYQSANQIDTAEVEVRVLDENDNTPVLTFPSETNNRTVISNTLISGNYVTEVKATDADIGRNAELTYELMDDGEAHYFTIDPEEGILFVNRDLTMLHSKNFVLKIVVKDRGVVPRMVIGSLVIEVNGSSPPVGGYNPDNNVDYIQTGDDDLSFTDIVAIIVGAASGTIILILFLVFIWLFFSKRRKPQKDAGVMPWYSTQPSKSPSNDDLVPDEKKLDANVNRAIVGESKYCSNGGQLIVGEKEKDHQVMPICGNGIREKSPAPEPALPVYTAAPEKMHTEQFTVPQIMVSNRVLASNVLN